MDEARAFVAHYCELRPALLSVLPVFWLGCGVFSRIVLAGVIFELRVVLARGLRVLESEEAAPYVKKAVEAWRTWPLRVLGWALAMIVVILPLLFTGEVTVAQFVVAVVHNLEVILALTTAVHLPRKYSWTIKALAISLRGVLESAATSLPLVGWVLIFFATTAPFGLVGPDTAAKLKRAPAHLLAELLFSKKTPPPAKAPPKATEAPAAPEFTPRRRFFGLLPPRVPPPPPPEPLEPAPERIVFLLLAVWFLLGLCSTSGLFAGSVEYLRDGADAAKEAHRTGL